MILSVVVPVYKAESSLHELVNRLKNSVPEDFIDHEIILVDDGSPDETWRTIKQLADMFPEIKGFRLSRNFGQHHAITTGLDNCIGNWVVVMDCDLQDQPEAIPGLYEKTKEGFNIVMARRINRKDRLLKRIQSAAFYWIFGYMTGFRFDKSIGNFGIYHKKCILSFRQMRESVRAFPTMMHWLGYAASSIDVEHAPRTHGKSNYNLRKLVRLAFDIALSYTDRPIKWIIKLGALVAFSSLIFIIYLIYQHHVGKISIQGYTSMMVSIWFLFGLMCVFIGVCGLYISRIFDTVKNRPLYIIEEII